MLLEQKISFIKVNEISGLSYFLQDRKYNRYRFYLSTFSEIAPFARTELSYRDQLYIELILNGMYKRDIFIKEIITGNLLLKDVIRLVSIWRLIKGYGTKGQRTHSNNNMVKKNRLLHNFRLEQFFQVFGQKKRNIYPTLIIGEYTNKLWLFTWRFEWIESLVFALGIAQAKTKKIPFDPVRLAKNHVNGFSRVGAAAKISKAKQVTKTVTIGLPLFFTRCLYNEFLPKEFPYALAIADADRRKMGRKSKKNKKK